MCELFINFCLICKMGDAYLVQAEKKKELKLLMSN